MEVYNGESLALQWKTDYVRNYHPYISSEILAVNITGDGVPDLVCTGVPGLRAIDGNNGSIIWELLDKGAYRSKIIDIDGDDRLEVVSLDLEYCTITDLLTGEIEVYTELDFSHDSATLEVADLDGDGGYEIVSGSFYGDVYIFNTTFGLLDSFFTAGPVYSVITADANVDGMLDVIAGTKGSGNIYAYLYASDPQTTVSTAGLNFVDLSTFFTVLFVTPVVAVLFRKSSNYMRRKGSI